MYDEVKLNIEDVWLGEPAHTEVDGSTTKLTPILARHRGLTYAAPLYLKLSTMIEHKKMNLMCKLQRCQLCLNQINVF